MPNAEGDPGIIPEEQKIKEWHRNVISSWSSLLDRLQVNELGRGIVSEGCGRYNLIGYILPLDEADSSHLIIFKNGFIAVTAAAVREDDLKEVASRIKEKYKKKMARSVNDFICGTQRPIDIIRELISDPDSEHGLRYGSVGRIVLTNETQREDGEFTQQAKRALALIRRNVTNRQRLVIQTTEEISGIFNSIDAHKIFI